MPVFKFWKMHGAGNDFVVVPDPHARFPLRAAARIRALCRRPDGIGAQGLIVLRPDRRADVRMLFFNPDGRSAEMCGNGARCAARLAVELGMAPPSMVMATGAGMVRAEVFAAGVRVAMPHPRQIRLRRRLRAGGRNLEYHFANTGVPHAVVFARDVQRVKVLEKGALLRYHPAFAPRGTNVDFVSRDRQGRWWVRTYERGVEDETGACGTGIVACAVVAARLGLATSPVTAVCRHGDRLRVDFRMTGCRIDDVLLTGPVCAVFTGKMEV